MTKLIFITEDDSLKTQYHLYLTQILQHVTDLISRLNLLELPDEVFIKFVSGRFNDDSPDAIGVAVTCVGQPFIEMMTNAIKINYVIESFIHELVHVQQGHLGWLRCADDNNLIWFDKYFRADILPYEEYMELPWERQAFREQKEIWRAIKSYIDIDQREDVDTLNLVN